MFRSREVLKSAQERDMLHVVDVAAERAVPVAGPTPVVADPDAAVPSSHPVEPPTSVPVSTFDAMMARCVRTTWAPDTQAMLFLKGSHQTEGTEEFRTLRSRLYQLREAGDLKTILVTSSLPGEGKTFVASNLAQVLALQPRCKVLLIDADMRSSRLHLVLGAKSTPGLAEYALGETDDEFGIIQNGADKNLFFIPAGRAVPGPTELVADSRLKSLIERLEPLFDWIILDSPATAPVSDSALLANYSDGVLMVVRSNSTPYDVVRKAREKFREEQLIGVVLNGIDSKTLEQNPYPQPASQQVA